MCTTDIFPIVKADGSKSKTREVRHCSAYRRGQPCEPVVYTHPARVVSYPDTGNTFLYPTMPPSPRHTPRNATPVYQSGEESERSNKSGGSSSSKKRSSGIYINGTKVMDFANNRKRASRGNERIVIVDSPPTPRTPPQTFAMPHTAPPSPNMSLPLPYNIVEAPRERRQPVIVDERPRPRPHVQIETVEPRRHGHRRGHSNSSHNSHSSSNNTSDSERRRRRDDLERAQEELRRQKIRARINAANAEINRRPAVPVPATQQRAATTYIRPGVEVKVPVVERGHARAPSREQELVDAVRQLDLGRHMVADAERRARRSRERDMDEDAAQRERLKERMMPRRRATVGPGSRRHRVLYDDGMYRWE